jgi:ABC-type Fe3+ transport system permease subunit
MSTKSNMAAAYVPSDCTVLHVIEWLPRDDTLPGFVVLTFLSFFVIGAILALLVVRCAAREVEVKRRKEASVSAPRDPSKDVWIFGYKVYIAIVLVLLFIFLINLLVVQITFATRENDEMSRSEKHMSERFSGSVWLWAILAALILLPVFGYLSLRCIIFPGMCQALNHKYEVTKI